MYKAGDIHTVEDRKQRTDRIGAKQQASGMQADK